MVAQGSATVAAGAARDYERWTWCLAQHSLGDRSQQEPLDTGPPVTPHDEQVGVNDVDSIEDLATDIGGFCDDQVERHVAQGMTREPLQLGEQARAIRSPMPMGGRSTVARSRARTIP